MKSLRRVERVIKMFTDAYSRATSGAVGPGTVEVSRVSHTSAAGLKLTTIEARGVTEFHLTLTPFPKETAVACARRLAEVIHSLDATMVRLIAFGPASVSHATLAALRQALDTADVPLTWVEGLPCGGAAIAGIQAQAIAKAEVQSLVLVGNALARIWRDAVATHCVLSNLGGAHPELSRPEQTRETFVAVQGPLAQVGMTMKDVARTWFFLDDILSWYGDFNRVRNTVFEQQELRPGSMPASTGVRGRNPAGAALTAAVWAVKPHDTTNPVATFVGSPRQCAATAYGSAFSRAVEINSGGHRQLLVSGTASIEPGGKTAHFGDVRAQIELTMQVVGELLQARGMSYADVSRATAYFKSGADLPLFQAWLVAHQLQALPVVNTCCEICRDDLLFEIEVDAVQAGVPLTASR
jgi:enamine deaminase RidA (YjgF/YER057c/UK114 family)